MIQPIRMLQNESRINLCFNILFGAGDLCTRSLGPTKFSSILCRWQNFNAPIVTDKMQEIMTFVIKCSITSRQTMASIQCDQKGLFLKDLGQNFYCKSSQNIWRSFASLKSAVPTFWASLEKLGYYYSNIWSHCTSVKWIHDRDFGWQPPKKG